MVIQGNMPVKGISDAWPETRPVFQKFGIDSSTETSVAEAADDDKLHKVLTELNGAVNSSEATCTAGG